ncbi:T-cell surface glycoprotein CD5 [Anolis sagrei]|uniref:T-cell surface glycoprotein CD5 n=1 Tax=Anolis sagrei TaxID=38937 RepID=UPI00351FABCB
MKRTVPMNVKHLFALIAVMLMRMWGVICSSKEMKSPEAWNVRLDGTGSRCSGWLKVLHEGKWKRISSLHWSPQSTEQACQQLHCGVPLGTLTPFSKEPEKQEVCLECQANATFKNCIWTESNCTQLQDVALVCQEPIQMSTVQPEPTTTTLKTTSNPTDAPVIRLEDGTALCSGAVELNFGGRWEMICLGLQGLWKELAPRVCQGKGCGDASGPKKLDNNKPLLAHWEKVQCERKNFSLDCLDKTKACLTLVKCSGQDLKSNASSTETILGILLGLVLTTFLLVTCVPPIYKKIMKKYFKKRQHQWVGPNAVNQNVSFHRNSSASFHPHQGQVVQEEDYTALKKTYLSPYAALEGATITNINPLDVSSDSDYDLSSAQRL